MNQRLQQFPTSMIAEWIKFLAAVLLIPVLTWAVVMERRVTSIESSRWTARDQATHVADMVELISLVSDKADSTSPQVAAELQEVKRRLERIEEKIDKMGG